MKTLLKDLYLHFLQSICKLASFIAYNYRLIAAFVQVLNEVKKLPLTA